MKRLMRYTVEVVDRRECEILGENVLSRTNTTPNGGRDYLYYRWTDSNGSMIVLRIATPGISGSTQDIVAEIEVQEP